MTHVSSVRSKIVGVSGSVLARGGGGGCCEVGASGGAAGPELEDAAPLPRPKSVASLCAL